jgi:EAL domain-containing protein (putative c-di-GMP-specific phosphodiesterase class I)
VRARALGCDLGQGFHFARPAPAGALDALLAAAAQGEFAV